VLKTNFRSLASVCVFLLLAACEESNAPPPVSVPPQALASAVLAPASAPRAELAPPATAFVPQRVWAEGKAMGTHLQFAAYTEPGKDEKTVRAAFAAAIEEFQRIEALMTTWTSTSEVSQINSAAGKAPVVVSDETREVIQASIKMHAASKGTFDITFETLHGLWKFDEDLDPNPPNAAALKAKLAFVGSKHLQVDDAKRTVYLDDARVKISLGGIAKGYAVDKAVAVIERAGIKAFFVQAGGDLFARGKKPDGKEWLSGVRDPRGPAEKYFAMLPISEHAFSTAGDYERSYVKDGKRFHHIIDPRTGYPAAASRSVTIWAKTAFEADAIDDAVFILGPEEGLKLVESIEGAGALIVDAKNQIWISKRLEGKVIKTGEPTGGI
jgi:FAD:protein FMN transferase